MNTTGPSQRPTSLRFRPFVTLFLLTVMTLSWGNTAFAQESDYIGIFWDSAYTEDSITTDTYPSVLTGYLVLKNPPSANGLVAWECCVDLDGPAQFLAWTLEGQALNVESEPCFAVAIGQTPLPSTGDVLLATFQIQVTEPLPVTLLLEPLYFASLPGQMAYIMADNTGVLLPMPTLTGEPEVAWINGHIPHLQVEPAALHFFDTVIGTTLVKTVTVSNLGVIPGYLDVSLNEDCDPFSLPGVSGAMTVPGGESLDIEVAFTPESLEVVLCTLTLGADLADISLGGSGSDLELSWEAPTEVDFGPVGVGTSDLMPVTIHNTGEVAIPIEPFLSDCDPGFGIHSGDFPSLLAPGIQRTIFLFFSPIAEGFFTCTLELGPIVPAVQVTGEGTLPQVAWSAPTSHDFGDVGVGLAEEWSFQVINTGNIPFAVIPNIQDTSQGFRMIAGEPTNLLPGNSMLIYIEYHPVTPGPHTGSLDMGATIPAILLEGNGVPRPAEWSVEPDSLVFEYVYLGSHEEKFIQIDNTGGTMLEMDILLSDPEVGFTVTQGAGEFQLEPGYSHEVGITFQPETVGFFETLLILGPELSPVPILGTGEDSGDVCLVQPESLVFGPIEAGTTQTLSFSVTNTGTQPLEITPSSNSPLFFMDGPDLVLYAGQSTQYAVLFQPVAGGSFTATIDLGEQLCTSVQLAGTATSIDLGNFVGMFFDPEYSYIETQTSTPNEVVEGYLVLMEPTESSGVGAWELAVGIDGDAQWMTWDIEGQNLNIGQDGEFIVAMGGAPLPYSEAILLATFQLLVAQPYPSMVSLEVGPIQNPSVPGQMVWAPWHDPGMLIPLHPFTGASQVAYINPYIIGIGRPAPLATLTGGSVELEWPAPDDIGEGCHLYRRDDSGADLRLTDQPLAGFGSTLFFTDHPTGYAPGTILYYSYTVITDGIEGDRSQETEVHLTGIPQVQSRLLPNVPNPFNPQTEIRFELDKPQQARVSIYDVTGRLVKNLADGQLAGGPHVRIWQGRDASGRQVPSGAYYVRLVSESRVDHQKIMLLK